VRTEAPVRASLKVMLLLHLDSGWQLQEWAAAHWHFVGTRRRFTRGLQEPQFRRAASTHHAAKPEAIASAGGLQSLLPSVKESQRFDRRELVDAQSLQFGQKHHCLRLDNGSSLE